MLWGTACLKSYAKTQGTIAQSSAESELIAVVKAACEAIGSVSLADDLGLSLRVRLHIDAQAALGILERQGVGRVRHLDIGVMAPGATSTTCRRTYQSSRHREPSRPYDKASRARCH